MNRAARLAAVTFVLFTLATSGCRSPYRSDQGALFGGLLGAGTGAIVGNQLGNTGAGAAIGAGIGALSGAVIGSELDEMEAANRAEIARQLGREVSANAVTIDDVIGMSQAGVDDDLIVSHVRAHGVARPLQPTDLSFLTQQNVSTRVIQAMQEPPRVRQVSQPQRVIVRESRPPSVIVHEYRDPCYHYTPPVRHYYSRRHSRPGMSVGMAFHN